ncbi:MAG: LPS export ABC transporter periplasmic protein LptC [Fimbriimonadaceae bacterium]|nr:LPS export ABC transporter periplasmic protein LptC [Fimbriimonadaceae bacterium]QYK56233.1 MAG: LPS export ABC transporter periplasmic protein LptC [Fimbriimonadaceae bacterium]
MVLLALLLVSGCSVPKRQRPAPKPEEREPEKITAIAPEITVTDKEGEKAFVVRSDSTRLELREGEGSLARLNRITGEIYRNGKIASRIEADTARVDQAAKTLTAFGNVRMTREEGVDAGQGGKPDLGGLVMNARRMVYSKGQERIEAEGDVTVSSDKFVMGPIPKLWANEDLTTFATPDKF